MTRIFIEAKNDKKSEYYFLKTIIRPSVWNKENEWTLHIDMCCQGDWQWTQMILLVMLFQVTNITDDESPYVCKIITIEVEFQLFRHFPL
mgnify:CR=1 FL=1